MKEWINLKDIVLWESNANEGDVGLISVSIEKHGFWGYVDIWQGNVCKGGNHTTIALRQLIASGWKPFGDGIRKEGKEWQVRMFDISHMSDAQSTALGLARNETTRAGFNDLRKLSVLLQQVAAADDVELEHAGYSGDQLDEILRELAKKERSKETPVEAQMDKAEELRQKWQTELGQVWEIPSKSVAGKSHRVICGDCTKDFNLVANGSLIDLIITDPPYGVAYADKNRFLNSISKGNRIQEPIVNDHASPDELCELWRGAFGAMHETARKGAVIYCFAPGGDQMMMMMMMMQAFSPVRHELIWKKNNHVLGRVDYAYIHESILYAWKEGGHKFYGDFQTSVLEFARPNNSDLHPTTKPVELIERLIGNSSLQGELVADPFLGSGTTMVAAERTGRICYGCEIEPRYVAVILQRMVDIGLEPRLIKNE